MVGAHISTSSFLLSYKKNCLLLPFRCFPIMSSRYTTRNNVRSHVFFSIVSARAQTRLFRLLFVFERRVVFWQEHQHHSQRDDQNDANKKGTTMRIKIGSIIIIIIIDRRKIDEEEEDSIAAIERRLKTPKTKSNSIQKEQRRTMKRRRFQENEKKVVVVRRRSSTIWDETILSYSRGEWHVEHVGGRSDGWEKMDPLKKLWVVWSGEKGVMYWMNQGSLYGAGFIAFCWVCFRFVGPILGLYELK